MGGFLPGGGLYDPSVAFNNSGEGGTWGPIFGNPFPPGGTGEPDDPWNAPQATPPTFGPTFSPPVDPVPPSEPEVNVPVSRDTFGGLMPDLLGLVAARGSLLSNVIRFGTEVAGAFLPPVQTGGQMPSGMPFPPGGPEPPLLPQVTVTGQGRNAAISVIRRNVAPCQLTTASGKTRGGRQVIVNGQIVCVPKPRRMSPCNPNAARRAVRRLNMVHNFMRSIEKSMQKTCRPMHTRRSSGGKCGTCRKVKCSC